MPDAPLEISIAPGVREDTTILSLVGPLTLNNLFGFQNEFRAMTPPRLILDLSQVQYIDSAGLGLLVNGHVSAERNGRKLLFAGVAPRVYTLLELTRVHTVLQIYPTVSEAEASA